MGRRQQLDTELLKYLRYKKEDDMKSIFVLRRNEKDQLRTALYKTVCYLRDFTFIKRMHWASYLCELGMNYQQARSFVKLIMDKKFKEI